MMTYPLKFRRHVLSIKKRECLTFARTAERFCVGIVTLTRWAKRIEPITNAKRPWLRINIHRLSQDIRDFPDAYHYERARRFGVSARGICDAMKRMRVTYKKTLKHPKADEGKRQRFQQKIAAYKAAAKPLVYIDESGFAHDIPRLHGYAPKGKRCYGIQDWNAKGRTNVIGVLLSGVMLSCWLCGFDGDSDVFHAWTINDLLPNLPPGSVVIMDNATFHKRADTQKAIKDAGHTLEYLPPYSPDFNPIENKWAQANAVRRRTGENVQEIFNHDF